MLGNRAFQIDFTPKSEETLVQELRSGDLSSFEALFHQYKGRIYSLCYRLVNDAGEAEDLTQEVFLQLFRKIHTFRGESAFATWFHRLAVNTALMHLRKKPDFHVEWTDQEIPDSAARRTAPPGAHGNLDRIHLERAIAGLPSGYRTIFVLHDVEGYDHQEIAEFLGCSPGTSKSQLHKARMRLRETLRR